MVLNLKRFSGAATENYTEHVSFIQENDIPFETQDKEIIFVRKTEVTYDESSRKPSKANILGISFVTENVGEKEAKSST